MSCLDDNTVSALMGGTLSPEAATAVERHVETCAACRQLVAALLRSDRDDAQETSANDTLLPLRLQGQVPMPAKGSFLGRYVVLEPIGAGGMGVVFSAYDPVLERKVAVKLVRGARSAEALEEVKGRLLREGKSIAQLSHPNIVSVFDMSAADGQVFVAMELVVGGSLRQWLKEKPRSWREVLEKFVSAGKGLSAAHGAGLVHRDFKPENVLVGNDGRVRVTDFGLASSFGAAQLQPSEIASLRPQRGFVTQEGAVVGTPAYMAPEQFSGHGADALSDQFSFCLALWEALYGSRPFHQDEWRLVEPPAQVKVPLWLKRVVLKGLNLEPVARFPTMEALLAALGADPDRVRRQRLRIGAGLASGLAVLFMSTYWASTRSERLCTGATARLENIWNPDVVTALHDTFVSTGMADAAATWELSRRALDDYWSAWAVMYTDACEATRVRGEQSDQLLSLRMACLDRRRDEGAALLDVFRNADAEVVSKAPEAVDALSGLRSCSDVEGLLAQVSPPSTPALRAKSMQCQSLLEEAKARFDAGRYQAALSRVTQAVSLARGFDYRPVLAEALLLQGRLEEHRGDFEAAEQALLEAISTAEASKHDAVVAEAATHLMLVLGARQARFAEAHAWGKLAEGAIARVGGNEPLQARLFQTQGVVYYAEGKLVQAIDLHQRAVALFEQLEPESLILADALNNLGASLRGGRQAKQSLTVFDRALDILLKKVGPESDLVASTRNGMASALMLEGRFTEALTLYSHALHSFKRRLGATHFRTVTSLNNIGVVLAEQSHFAEALPYFEQVLNARQRTLSSTDAKLADAHSNVGMLLVELGKNDEALTHFEKARGILQGYPLDHFSQAEAQLGFARIHLAQGMALKALPFLEHVLRLCEGRNGFRFEYTRARADFLMGRTLWEGQHKHQEGRRLVLKARDALTQFGPERFHRDLAQMETWLAAHQSVR